MYTVKTASSKSFTINKAEIDGEKFDVDFIETGNGGYHLLYKGKSYTAEIIAVNTEEKTVQLSLNGIITTMQLSDQYDILLQKLGMTGVAKRKINNIKAPMPGLVVDIKIAAGDTIEKGQAVIILEAMKMENIIKAPGEGVVKKIAVQKGQAVEKGDILLELDL